MSANRQGTERKAPKTAFKPGKSGNPSGRPKKTPEELDLIAACKKKTPDALEVIEHIMRNGQNERNQLAAAMAIIERAYGKAVQAVDAKVDGNITVVIRKF